MHTILLSSLIALGATAESTAAAAPSLGEGTLIFLENVNSVVEFSTRGKIGHVALAFTEGQEAYIYEATPGEVRRVSVTEYYAELARLNKRRDDDDQIRVLVLRPKQAYSAVEVAAMRKYLDSQVGRRYSLRNYVRGKPGDGGHSARIGPVEVQIAVDLKDPPSEGIHCAELASTTLNQTDRYGFENCHRISPLALYAAMKPLSAPPQELAIPPLKVKEPWCVRAQRRTAEWFTWCGWSCQEAWAWCW
jgi:hypothetical protein